MANGVYVIRRVKSVKSDQSVFLNMASGEKVNPENESGFY